MRFSSLVLVAPLAVAVIVPRHGLSDRGLDHDVADFECNLPSPLDPSSDGLHSAGKLFGSKAALEKQVERHSALVKVPSICYDDLGPFDEDPRWAPFYEFHVVLSEVFPLV